jgi:hypothetical protein
MVSLAVWGTPYLQRYGVRPILSSVTLRLVSGLASSRRTIWHCSRMPTRLTGINYVAYPHVLQDHDDPDVRRLKNRCTCVRNMCA